LRSLSNRTSLASSSPVSSPRTGTLTSTMGW
jgi:hypothetical protein